MIKYSQGYTRRRKVLFEKYFSLDRSGGLVNKFTPDQPCGVCDNCTRTKDSWIATQYDTICWASSTKE